MIMIGIGNALFWLLELEIYNKGSRYFLHYLSRQFSYVCHEPCISFQCLQLLQIEGPGIGLRRNDIFITFFLNQHEAEDEVLVSNIEAALHRLVGRRRAEAGVITVEEYLTVGRRNSLLCVARTGGLVGGRPCRELEMVAGPPRVILNLPTSPSSSSSSAREWLPSSPGSSDSTFSWWVWRLGGGKRRWREWGEWSYRQSLMPWLDHLPAQCPVQLMSTCQH